MFEGDWSELDAAATLGAAVEFSAAENHAALGKLKAALHFAELHAELPAAYQHAPARPGGERLKVYGGDGCPAVAEFAPVEYAAVLGLSTRAAVSFLGEALALRHRFPRLWARTLAEVTPVWRARAVARACLSLSKVAAAWVDQRIVGRIDTLSTYRLFLLLDALILQADSEAARRAAEERALARGVWVNPSDEHGTKTIYVKAATGDVIRFDATVCDLAWALAMMGDSDTLDQRRAKAIGWIADPAAAFDLIAAARFLATQQRNGIVTGRATGVGTGVGSGVRPDQGTTDPAVHEPGIDPEAEQVSAHPGTGEHLDQEDPDQAYDGGDEWFPGDERASRLRPIGTRPMPPSATSPSVTS